MKMAKTPPTPLQITLQELGEARARMRAASANIGEPAVELPMEDIQVFKGEDGQLRAIMRVDKLIHVVDRVLRS
jgi:hypothetical protein